MGKDIFQTIDETFLYRIFPPTVLPKNIKQKKGKKRKKKETKVKRRSRKKENFLKKACLLFHDL